MQTVRYSQDFTLARPISSKRLHSAISPNTLFRAKALYGGLAALFDRLNLFQEMFHQPLTGLLAPRISHLHQLKDNIGHILLVNIDLLIENRGDLFFGLSKALKAQHWGHDHVDVSYPEIAIAMPVGVVVFAVLRSVEITVSVWHGLKLLLVAAVRVDPHDTFAHLT